MSDKYELSIAISASERVRDLAFEGLSPGSFLIKVAKGN